MSEIVLRDIGPIHTLRLPVPEGGGVVVLRGRNGAGKSGALDAVAAMAGHKVKPSCLPIRDGQRTASVEGLGVKLSLAGRVSRNGEIVVQTIDRHPISKFVDPGIVDQETADDHRIRAILEIARVPASLDLFRPLMPKGVDIQSVVSEVTLRKEDLVDMASSVRADLQKSARNTEEQASQAGTKAAVIRAGLPAADAPPETSPAAIEEKQRQAAQELGAARHELKVVKEQHAEYLSAVAVLANTEVSQQQEQRAALKAEVARIERQISDSSTLRQELVKRLAGVDADLAAATLVLSTAVSTLERLERENEQATKARAVVERGEPDVTACEAKAGMLANTMTELTNDMLAAREWSVRAGKLAEAETLQEQTRTLKVLAEALRASADSIDSVLNDAVAMYIPALQVHERRLKIEYPNRGLVPYAELSHGERWAIGIDFASAAVGENGLIVIDQIAWEGLDEHNRGIVAHAAKSRKVTVLTAECSDDDVVVCEQYGDAANNNHTGDDLPSVSEEGVTTPSEEGNREGDDEGVTGGTAG